MIGFIKIRDKFKLIFKMKQNDSVNLLLKIAILGLKIVPHLKINLYKISLFIRYSKKPE